MDEDICRWIINFLLRQPIDDNVIKLAISSLPLPPDSSIPLDLKKSILLRTILSDLRDASISETLLGLLESLEAIDGMLGHPVSGYMKDAYRAVALDCTLRCLRCGVEEGEAMYSAAVQKLWRGKFRAMEANSELITAELLRWSAQLEAATSDETERENLMRIDTSADALRSVRAYLDEAYAKLGPSFLETAALATAVEQADAGSLPSGELAAGAAATSQGENTEAPETRDSSPSDADTPCNGHQSAGTKSKNERPKRVLPWTSKQVWLHRRVGGGIKISDKEEPGGTSRSSYDSLPASLVDKVQESLKSSCLALQTAVEDPLPDAMRVAASLVYDGADTAPTPEPLPQDQAMEDSGAPDPSLDGNATDAAAQSPGNCQPQPSGNLDVLPRRNLMERNSSAQTYQWDDSEGTSDEKDRPQLHSPKRVIVSPLRIVEPQKIAHRRPRKKWSLEEEQTLRDGVNRFGQGNWKLILNNYRDIFSERTEVDLKDKWRNLTR